MKKILNAGSFLLSAIIGAAAGLLNGLFGSGGGTILVPAMERFLKIKPQKAHATSVAIILPLTIVSAVIYSKLGEINWQPLVFISIGGVAGGFLGAKLLTRISDKWLHRIFGLFMIFAAIRMIL